MNSAMEPDSGPPGLSSERCPPARTRQTLAACRWAALAVGGVGGAASVVGYATEPSQFARSYLLAFVFWLGVPLGCLAIALLHELVGGRWGELLRPFVSTAYVTIPLFVALFTPLWWRMEAVYPWHEAAFSSSEGISAKISPEKRLYLNPTGFTWRSGGYFVLWCLGSVTCFRWSVSRERRAQTKNPRGRQRLAAIGVLMFVVTVSFAGVDWLMSLEPTWYSSIYGALVVVGMVLTAWCFVLVIAGLSRSDNESRPCADQTQAFHDVGNLLLAFLLVWMYFAFSQFLIIWSGDLPEETAWYRDRLSGGWQWFVPAIVIGHFVVPFTLLLSRDVKRTPRYLAAAAGIVLLMRFIDLYWNVMPAFSPRRFTAHWLDVATVAGVGGLWLAVFATVLIRRYRTGL